MLYIRVMLVLKIIFFSKTNYNSDKIMLSGYKNIR